MATLQNLKEIERRHALERQTLLSGRNYIPFSGYRPTQIAPALVRDLTDNCHYVCDREFRSNDRLKFRSPDYVFRSFKNKYEYSYILDEVDYISSEDRPPIVWVMLISLGIDHNGKEILLRSDNLRPINEPAQDWIPVKSAGKTQTLDYRSGIIGFGHKIVAEAFALRFGGEDWNKIWTLYPTLYKEYITHGYMAGSPVHVISGLTLLE